SPYVAAPGCATLTPQLDPPVYSRLDASMYPSITPKPKIVINPNNARNLMISVSGPFSRLRSSCIDASFGVQGVADESRRLLRAVDRLDSCGKGLGAGTTDTHIENITDTQACQSFCTNPPLAPLAERLWCNIRLLHSRS